LQGSYKDMFLDVNNIQLFHTTLYAASQLRKQLHIEEQQYTLQKFENITIFNGFELSLFCSPRQIKNLGGGKNVIL